MTSRNMRGMLTMALCFALILTIEGATKKKRRSAKDWDKIMKEEEDRLFKEEEAEREARKPAMPSMDPEALKEPGAVQKMMAAQRGGKTTMLFVTVDTDTKEETEKLSGKYRGVLKEANGVDAVPYVIEDDKMLFTLMDGHLTDKLMAILVTFPEVAELTIDQAKTPGPAHAAYFKKHPPKEAESKDKPPKDET